MPIPVPDYESETESIKRFYDRVCTFVHHQRMADPLMDVLVYFLKEYIKTFLPFVYSILIPFFHECEWYALIIVMFK